VLSICLLFLFSLSLSVSVSVSCLDFCGLSEVLLHAFVAVENNNARDYPFPVRCVARI
jgi:hypothetical protein